MVCGMSSLSSPSLSGSSCYKLEGDREEEGGGIRVI